MADILHLTSQHSKRIIFNQRQQYHEGSLIHVPRAVVNMGVKNNEYMRETLVCIKLCMECSTKGR